MFTQSRIARKCISILSLSVFVLSFMVIADDSFAYRRGKRRYSSPRHARQGHVVRKLPRGYKRVWHKKTPYYYQSGVFYKPSLSGFVVVGAPIGSVVFSIPIGYTRVWVGDVGYYLYGGVFYRRSPSGYMVVESPSGVYLDDKDPAVVQPPENASGSVSVTVSVLNVRAGPSLNYPVIYQIYEGYVLDVHGRDRGWLYVELPNGEFGWVKKVFTTRLFEPGSG